MQISQAETSRHITMITSMMFEAGIYLTFGSDFASFKNQCSKQPDKGHVHPAFDVDTPREKPIEGTWIIGRNRSGEIIHTQAIRVTDLGNKTLPEHILSNLEDFALHGYDLDLDRTEIFMTKSASQIRGRITYHGELWLKGGPTGIRGGSNVVLLTRLMLLLAAKKWTPNYMIGLQSPKIACRGLSAREGYARCEQRSILWYPKDGSPPLEDWLVWMDAEEADFNLRLPPEFFVDLFEGKPEQTKTAHGMVA